MSFQPAMGPGTLYSILVSDKLVEQAKVVLSNLPIEIDTEPEVWHFGSSEKQKRWWKIFTWFILALIALFFGAFIYNLF